MGDEKELTPEGHANTRNRVQHSESANRLRITRLPKRNLPLTHPREARRRDPVMLAHPDGPAVLGARVAGMFADGPLLAHVPHADLLVARRRRQQRTRGVPGQALHDVVVAQGVVGLAGRDVPELDGEVSRRGGDDVFGGGVKEDLSDFSGKGG